MVLSQASIAAASMLSLLGIFVKDQRQQLRKLKIYSGGDSDQCAQNLASGCLLNRRNIDLLPMNMGSCKRGQSSSTNRQCCIGSGEDGPKNLWTGHQRMF